MLNRNKWLLVLAAAVVAAAVMSCTSVWNKKYKDDAGVMYGMIYDEREEGVALEGGVGRAGAVYPTVLFCGYKG